MTTCPSFNAEGKGEIATMWGFPVTGRRHRVITKIGAVLLAAQIGGSRPPVAAGSSPVSSDPLFKALLIDGGTRSGRIVAFSAGAITIANREGAKEELPINRLVKLTREGSPAFSAGEDAQAV